jgi:hypothetical protein
MSHNPSQPLGRILGDSRGLHGQASHQPLVLARDAHDLAVALGVSKGTVEKLRDQGILVCVKLTDRCIRYPLELNLRRLERLALGQPLDDPQEAEPSQA